MTTEQQTLPSVKEANGAYFDLLQSGNEKQAADVSTRYIRMKMREDGFFRKILPFEPLLDADIQRRVDTDKPVYVGEKEPDSPAAYSVPFGALPNRRYIIGRKYEVHFQRIFGTKYQKDIAELRTYDQDIRQILSDITLKELMAQEDGKFIATDKYILGGAADALCPETAAVHWKTITGGITRATWKEARQIMPGLDASFSASTCLINNVSILEFEAWTRNDVGGDYAQQIAMDGFGQKKWFGLNFVVTIKKNLVPNNRAHFFAEAGRFGRAMTAEDVTMSVSTKDCMVSFYPYEMIGATLVNPYASTIADFDPA